MTIVTVVTVSGSKYFFRHDGKRLLVSAENIPNPTSRQLVGEWEVEVQPWPPRVGERLVITSVLFEKFDHPLRMPGGGKITSPVHTISIDNPPCEELTR